MRMDGPVLFGIRHLSPAGAWHLRRLLDRVQPKIVLIEGPSDLNGQLCHIVNPKTRPPIAILAYTQTVPVRTILYPFAVYSPEYQAILWAHENRRECRFIDLPSGVFLALSERRRELEGGGREGSAVVYEALDEYSGEDGHETFWERTMEHSVSEDAYFAGAGEFGRQLRSLTAGADSDWAETVVREAYMKRQIMAAVQEGFSPDEMVVVTGAYHVAGLETNEPMTDEEEKALPILPANQTLMPYSYYRLSSRSGYGAGNKAPAYYELLWKGLLAGDAGRTATEYLSSIAAYQRNYGNMVSSAEVIEAVRLAASLAGLHGCKTPALCDLRDAAVTCMGHGNLSEIALAVADTEIGTRVGQLPEGVSRTSVQEDFYRQLDELNLRRFHSVTAQELSLDLREKLGVKSERSAFLDLSRSFFLHRLRVLGVGFAALGRTGQQKATWAEEWVLRWTPETEIEIVEAALLGDTVAGAASYALRERCGKAGSIGEIAAVIEDAFFCGMAESVEYATGALQRLAADAAALDEIAKTAKSLSVAVSFGSIRKLDPAPLLPILSQLFLRACLLLPGSAVCDNNAAASVVEAVAALSETAVAHDFLDQERWLAALSEVASRDDLNTKVSGYAAAILLERGGIDGEALSAEVGRRLSKGIPADLGAGWFEGLSMRNHYSLIARMSLWEKLAEYIDDLDDEEFKRALVFLRRAFADFSAKEKDEIAENLGEIWQVNPAAVSEILNAAPSAGEQELIAELDEFDFGDI